MLKRIVTLSLALAFMALPLKAQKWDFDQAHSSIEFSVRHMVISTVKGNFGDYDGTVNFDGKNMENASVDIVIQMASINTNNERRDNHLRSGDFFNVDSFPTMTFKSKKIVPGTDNKFQIIGDLTIKGVTHEVTLSAEFHGIINDPRGNTRAGFSAETEINRQDFNVSWDNKLKDGSLVVSDDVKIMIEAELVKSDGN